MSGHRSSGSKEPWPWQKPKATPKRGTATRRPPAKRTAAGSGSGRGGSGRGRPPAKPRRSALRRWTRRIFFGGLIGFVLVVVGLWVAYANTGIPDPNEEFQAETTYVYYADGKTVLGKFALQDRQSIELDEMGAFTTDAAIAAEDRTFYTNKGIDPKGIIRAAFSNAQGNATQGASTITQQYVKILYLSSERSYKRKLHEAFVALKLRDQKDEVLKGYLNTIYFGRGAYGIEAAARAYFGISAKQLNLKQSAALAAVINSPNNYDPAKGKEAKSALFSRYLYVLDGLSKMDKISSAEYAQASRKLPRFPKVRGTSGYTGQNGYVLEMVRNELRNLDYSDQEIDTGGLRITTTIDKKVMDAAADGVAEAQPEGLDQLHIGVASVDPKTGGLKGIYAGAPYEQTDGGTNWATTGQAPGSTFKAFALAAGLTDGYSLKSTFNGSSPLEIGGIEFNNQGEGQGRSYGTRLSLLEATKNSVNTAFVDLTDAMEDGPNKVLNTAVKMGIPRCPKCGLRPELGIPLGSADISPVDMANGYATIAAQGVAKKWYVVDLVKSADGTELTKHQVRTKRVLEEDVAADVTYALENVVLSGTGRNAQMERDVAGKTGTATDDDGNVRSSWFVGFTPQLATAVMYVRGDGNDPLQDYMPTFFGGEYPARTFNAVMERAMEGVEEEEFPPPANKPATLKDHQPLPTFTPKPSRPPKETPTKKPSKTPTEVPSSPPPPEETSAPPTIDPTPTADPCQTPCDELVCQSPPCPPGQT